MHSIYLDPDFDDGKRRAELYDGQLIVRSSSLASAALVRHAKTMIQEAFSGMDPRMAQYDLSVEEFVARFAPLKTAFIHDPRSKECLRAMLAEAHCDPDETYIDVPRLRVATSDGYLTSGVAYAHHPHRDTWYSAPMAQVNWWMPIFDYDSSAGMAFHPRYWDRGVRNGSPAFDYYRWNSEGRAQARLHVRSDTRVQPKSEEPLELQPEIRVIPRAGGTVMFSAAQLHSTSRNASGMSRWSVDFRTVNLPDVVARRGAPNVDSAPSGTSLRDFVKMRDLSPMPEDVARAYDDRENNDGILVYAGDGEVR
jgi:hypothetical protein